MSRGGNKRTGKKYLGVLSATDPRGDVGSTNQCSNCNRSVNYIQRRDGGHSVEEGAVKFDGRKLR